MAKMITLRQDSTGENERKIFRKILGPKKEVKDGSEDQDMNSIRT